MPEKLKIISLNVHHLSFEESLEQVTNFAIERRPSFICFANVHMAIEAYNDTTFLQNVDKANLVLADGQPIASSCTLLHHKKQERISGMDFTYQILEKINDRSLSVFVYGSTNEVIDAFRKKIIFRFSKINFAGAISPPFRTLTAEETKNDIEIINKSRAHVVLVALGCPKQENWMADNSNKIHAVLLGIGGALPVVAGIRKRAPEWMQNMALEWSYRLFQQPKRLFRRYLYTNSKFLVLLFKELIKKSFGRS